MVNMNKKQQKTLSRLKDKPTRADISWNEVQSFFKAIGAQVRQDEGSRIQVILNTRVLRLHKPHPQKDLKKYAVEAIRDFLINVEGIK
ncbi:MAG: type II toxin-antitoxin system HicA family toxin [Pseudomonadota bacterium]